MLTPRLLTVSDLVGGGECVLIIGEAPPELGVDLERRGCKVQSLDLTPVTTEASDGPDSSVTDFVDPDRVSGTKALPAGIGWGSFSVVVMLALDRLPQSRELLRELSAAIAGNCRLVVTFHNAAFAATRLALLSGVEPTPDIPPGLTRAAAMDLLTLTGWDVLHSEATHDQANVGIAAGFPGAVTDWVEAAPDASVAEYVMLCATQRDSVDGLAALIGRLSAQCSKLIGETSRLSAELAGDAEREAVLIAGEAQLRRQLDEVAETATEAELDVLELEDKLFQRDKALGDARETLAKVATTLEHYERHIHSLEIQQTDWEARLTRAEPLAARAEVAEDRLAAVVDSRSWRLVRRAGSLTSWLRRG